MSTLKGQYSSARTMLDVDLLEESCVQQIQSFLDHPAFTNPVAIMADAHAGKGAVIGFTMPMTTKVIPNVIGVDIGCGMLSLDMGKDLAVKHEQVDALVREQVPFGFHTRSTIAKTLPKEGFHWAEIQERADKFAESFACEFGQRLFFPRYSQEWFTRLCRRLNTEPQKVLCSVGTLGGGNHFIEIGRSPNTDHLWATIHTGSRNIGKRIAEFWQAKAVEANGNPRKRFAQQVSELKDRYTGPELGAHIQEAREGMESADSAPPGLEWLANHDVSGYLSDMVFAQAFASLNREVIAQSLIATLGGQPLDKIESVHNFIDFDDLIIRKGAIRSYKGERMIIPFNMRDGVLICEGRSAEQWNCSAPHGAGRVLSRRQARQELDVGAFQQQMSGIYSTSVGKATLDEAPDAYKDAHMIEEAIQSTAIITDRLIPIHNMKSTS